VADVEPGSADYISAMTHAWLVADESLQTVVGDPNFVDVPVDELTDAEQNSLLASDLGFQHAAAVPGTEVTLDKDAGAGIRTSSTAGNTTHLSVVDADGLAVSMTNTITAFWGSGQEVGGFFVNDHLRRFGVGRTDANVPEAGRRPVSYMTPAVVLDDQDRPVLVVGSPGGRRIPNIEATVIARWALQGQPLQDAVDAPRFHLEGDLLQVEELPDGVTADLTEMGYAVTPVPLSQSLFGSVQALELNHSARRLIGATDERRTGDWASGPSPSG
jgi:gamma-glutamyltranspeptidase/glutathione hydrolase